MRAKEFANRPADDVNVRPVPRFRCRLPRGTASSIRATFSRSASGVGRSLGLPQPPRQRHNKHTCYNHESYHAAWLARGCGSDGFPRAALLLLCRRTEKLFARRKPTAHLTAGNQPLYQRARNGTGCDTVSASRSRRDAHRGGADALRPRAGAAARTEAGVGGCRDDRHRAARSSAARGSAGRGRSSAAAVARALPRALSAGFDPSSTRVSAATCTSG